MTDAALWLITGVAFVLGAFYSGCETAFIAADRIRLRHLADQNDRRAQLVLRYLADPEYFLSAVLVGTNLAVTGCTIAFTALMIRRFGESGDTVATIILVPFFLVFNEIVPKGLFLYYSNQAALLSADLLRASTRLLYPLIRSLSWIAESLTNRLHPEPGAESKLNVTMEELLFHLDDSRGAGLIGHETTVLADRTLSLRDMVVKDVMVDLDDVSMIDFDAPPADYAETFEREGYSRLPVYRGQRENVVGVLSVHELMMALAPDDLKRELRPPYTVAVDDGLGPVLYQMRENGRHMAMVTDEAGAIVGMTTMEDILEQLVGTITDEFN